MANVLNLTPAMVLALEDARKLGGKMSSPPVNSSTYWALDRRGLIDRRGMLTQDAMNFLELEAEGAVMQCSKCSKPVKCLHTIPMGTELCGRCSRGVRPGQTRQRSPIAGEMLYEGGYVE